ncbi:hypothetical protein NO932_11810 [Pelagibacterium sp. 26DY04]|uniref:hypothetical protein n=1 Tax=Pelagibacterium sp. 26DY04 TaxID=2967130 RepID=UPI002814E321|nr:hypothetical protein [Pelagibacterium sp. 26DY04]WMT85614.1 hypothetical protein NO932_11810 [Pelagibacterium sp. 26DY04]
MTISKHVRDAARIIRRYFIAPYRQRKLARALGCDDALTKFRAAKRDHKATKPHIAAIKAANLSKLRSETYG